ncbi:hypothetical protein Y032_0003g1596 [Ancylostoma ceylanicum]|uniref:SWIM-type domain-containing protein n=2 Tax=Ancylostoma ceylanicum TaxID=53326 RepID=A0A016VYJ3_9BILA|nr:hypothetical protein Y032_0003g1596 [Ancylostoma ceylanicum]
MCILLHMCPLQPSRAMDFRGGPSTSRCNAPDESSSLANSIHFCEVLPVRASYNARHLLPDVNYCTCKYFEKQVMKRKNRMTCSHVLAMWMSRCVNSCPKTVMKRRTVDLIAKQFVCRSQEFF